ncbi:hypothetical protein AYO20_09312 [Fonsecaea nubica]|uniref:Ketoreductase domain-containing protein n=1 Tax=Fonsecaea nubica TaxID=856822 RepID=A0A178CGR9_9EURO|nr:hypothetical protein AYO20_09312 [Fonsecaea nubica]OAL29159.1 hypothetical protein AYO20_09312 [Fonsecaea nubica]
MATQIPRVPTSQLFSLEGKTVVATGGTGGLGLEICIALAEAGADIVSIHLPRDPGQTTLEEGVRKLGRKVIGFECDVGDSKQLRETFDRMWKADVVPDILLNCAGLNRRGPIEDMTDDKIDLVGDGRGRASPWPGAAHAFNLKGAYVAAQEFGQRLIQLGRPGKIINFGSFTSYVAMTNVSAYAATKGGVLQMTKAFTLLDQFPEMEEYIVNRTPAGRWGNPSDLRGTAIFLASPASDFVTGTSIVVDGGMMFR